MQGCIDWVVPADHAAFAGHFPGAPILPGVVLLDEAIAALTAAIGRPLAPGRIAAAKFMRPVAPGESLQIRFDAATEVRVDFYSGDQLVASARFAATSGGAAL